MTRFEAQERRLQHNANLRDQYKDFIKEFKSLGNLERVPDLEINNGCQNHFYQPHHAVLKESSTTTKLRVVSDGSAKTLTGTSLNYIRLVGPTLQPDIFDLLIRFRQYMIGMTADVAKMYRQNSISQFAAELGTQWKMIPPRAPHFGRIWGTGINAAKKHSIRRVMGTTVLTSEEFQTLVMEVEAILNSRPISPMSSEPND